MGKIWFVVDLVERSDRELGLGTRTDTLSSVLSSLSSLLCPFSSVLSSVLSPLSFLLCPLLCPFSSVLSALSSVLFPLSSNQLQT
uniref:Uncharacterized protein n=1 Tax=Knipowitschia caucasica TaxID=637954 RepID=A0AAV2J0N0_KNICA